MIRQWLRRTKDNRWRVTRGIQDVYSIESVTPEIEDVNEYLKALTEKVQDTLGTGLSEVLRSDPGSNMLIRIDVFIETVDEKEPS